MTVAQTLRHRARQIVAEAIERGDIKPEPCSECGHPEAEPYHPVNLAADPLNGLSFRCRLHYHYL